MAKYSIHRPTIVVDSNFFIPESLEGDLVYREKWLDEDAELEVEEYGTEVVEISDMIGDLEVPENVTVTQTSRMGPGGKMVVDLTIEVDDIDDLTQYDVRVTKE